MTKCVKSVNTTLTRLSAEYLEANVYTVLHQACEGREVREDIGGSEASCKELMKELATELHGERNYYKWCRSLTLASFGAMQKIEELFEKNKTMVALRDKCSEHCPMIAKMIEVGSKFSMFAEQLYENFDYSNPDSMFELLEISMRQMNQLCDWQQKKICTVRTMHSSCSELMDAGGVGGEEGLQELERLEGECKSREPCRKACHGVDAFLTDFTMQQFKLTTQLPLPNASIGRENCKAVDHLMQCTEQPACEEYLNGKLSKSYPSGHDYLESWNSTCKWFKDDCASTREEKCKKEVGELKEAWAGNFACLVGEPTQDCCRTLDQLGACDVKEGCGEHLLEGIPLLDAGLEERLRTECPQLMHTFPGMAPPVPGPGALGPATPHE